MDVDERLLWRWNVSIQDGHKDVTRQNNGIHLCCIFVAYNIYDGVTILGNVLADLNEQEL